jgi:hypothetical protein
MRHREGTRQSKFRFRGSVPLGQTDPEGLKGPVRPTTIEDVHATVLTALGLDPAKENPTPGDRPAHQAQRRPGDPGIARVSGLEVRSQAVRRGCHGTPTGNPSRGINRNRR